MEEEKKAAQDDGPLSRRQRGQVEAMWLDFGVYTWTCYWSFQHNSVKVEIRTKLMVLCLLAWDILGLWFLLRIHMLWFSGLWGEWYYTGIGEILEISKSLWKYNGIMKNYIKIFRHKVYYCVFVKIICKILYSVLYIFYFSSYPLTH